MARLAVRISRP